MRRRLLLGDTDSRLSLVLKKTAQEPLKPRLFGLFSQSEGCICGWAETTRGSRTTSKLEEGEREQGEGRGEEEKYTT